MYAYTIRRIANAKCERSPKVMSNKFYCEQNVVLIFADFQFVVLTSNLKFISATIFWYTNIFNYGNIRVRLIILYSCDCEKAKNVR